MRTISKGLIALMAVVLLASPSLAQRPGGGGQGRGGQGGPGMGMGGMGQGGAMMAAMPAVQQELKLSDEQKSKVQAIVEESRSSMQGLRGSLQDVPQGERMAKMRELMTEANEKGKKALADVLDDAQMARFEQIELQVRGAEAYADAKVHEALDLTGEQKEKVQSILTSHAAEQRSIMQDAQGDMQGAMAKLRELREATAGKIKALMTDAQTSTWKEMIGEPFELGPRRGGQGRRDI